MAHRTKQETGKYLDRLGRMKIDHIAFLYWYTDLLHTL